MWKTHHDHWYSHPQIDGQENNCDFDDLLSIYNRPIIFGDDYISLYINVSFFHNFHMVSLYFPMGFPHVNVHIARSWDRQGKAFCWPWRCGAIISKDGFHQADIIRWFHNSIVPFRYTYVNVIYIYYTQNLLMYVYWYYCYCCYYYYVYIIIYIYMPSFVSCTLWGHHVLARKLSQRRTLQRWILWLGEGINTHVRLEWDLVQVSLYHLYMRMHF